MGICDFCDDYNYGIKQVAGNDDFEYGIKQAGNDDYNYDKGRYLFFRLVAQGRRTSSYRRRPGFSPSMQPMVFWPHAGAWGAGVIHSAMRSAFVVSSCMYEEFTKTNKKNHHHHHFFFAINN